MCLGIISGRLNSSQNLLLPDSLRVFKGSHQKKSKKNHNKCELWGEGQQILVCEPQKSAFFRANFAKKHAEINS